MKFRHIPCCVVFLLSLGFPRDIAGQPLEGEEKRERWQRVADIARAMRIGEGSTVADVGAGYGFVSVRLASIAGPKGKVYAVDVDPEPLKV